MSITSVRAMVLSSFVLSLFVAVPLVHAQAPVCAKSPEDAWRLAREAVATKDAGNVMMRLSPAYQTRNSIETAVGASMVAEIGGLSGSMSKDGGAAAKAAAAEKQLLTELDGILKKHKAMTIKEIGTPLMMRMSAPEVVKRFSAIDHVAYARDMNTFFAKVEAAAKAAGVSGEPVKLDELVSGYGDLNAPLTDLKVTGETAKAISQGKENKETMLFRRINGCWLVDGRE